MDKDKCFWVRSRQLETLKNVHEYVKNTKLERNAKFALIMMHKTLSNITDQIKYMSPDKGAKHYKINETQLLVLEDYCTRREVAEIENKEGGYHTKALRMLIQDIRKYPIEDDANSTRKRGGNRGRG